jgi:hypothetical protein
MRREAIVLTVALLLGALSWPVVAQLRPGAFSTLVTTGATTNDVCAGCAVGAASTTAAGYVNAGAFQVGTAVLFSALRPGAIAYISGGGLNIYGMTGSADDVLIRNGAGTPVVVVPTGTTTTTFFGSTTVGGSNLTDSSTVPTINSGFGASPTIAGHPFAFTITVSSTPGTGGVVNFNTTFNNIPVCLVSTDAGSTATVGINGASLSTTQVGIQYTNVLNTNHIYGACRGY